jgi:glucose/arabinose dehydrogenase/cytochrome c553
MKLNISFLIISGLLLFSGRGLKPVERGTGPTVSADSTRIEVTTVATGLDVPWEMAWGPDKRIWFTEQGGTISSLNPQTGEKKELLKIKEVLRLRSLGLLGMAFHPDFGKSPFVYVDYTSKKISGKDSVIVCKLVRYTFKNNALISPKVLLEIPGNTGHNGSRITISPDRKIMFATGDAVTTTNAQDIHSLNGKVLRINLDGSIPADNPIKSSLVWSRGHRNIQGLVYGPNGILYSSEHGDASDDELNIIQKGKNYGWIRVQGYCDEPKEKAFCDSVQVTEPIKAWTPTIAPAGIDFYNSDAIPEWKNAILLTTLKDNDLRVLKLDRSGKKIQSEKIYFDKVYGRIRDLCVAPNGDIYISTSNRDWNPAPGFPKETDDRILRISRSKTGQTLASASLSETNNTDQAGKKIYSQYCASCHKPDGMGIPGTFPPLRGAEQVAGIKTGLLNIIINGLQGAIKVNGKLYDQHMPAFGFLSDQDIAAVSTYVRMNFGGQTEGITASEVAAVRKVKTH